MVYKGFVIHKEGKFYYAYPTNYKGIIANAYATTLSTNLKRLKKQLTALLSYLR